MENKTIEKSLAPYQKQSGLLLTQANDLKIKTETEIKFASDVLGQIDGAQKRIKAERNKVVDPAKVIIKWAKGVFNPLLERYDEAEMTIKGKMLVFSEKEKAKADKKLKAVAEKVASGKLDIDQASEKVKDIAPAKSYAGESGSVQIREIKKIVITNVNEIPRKYMVPDTVIIRQAIKEGIKIPGVEVQIERTVAKGKA